MLSLIARVDAAIVDNLSAQEYLAAHAGGITVLSPPLTDEPYVVAMPVQASGLAGQVNSTIDRLRASGQLNNMMGMPAR